MAGNYTDPPAARMAYDRDGTQMYQISGAGVITARPGSALIAWNSEAFTGPNFGTGGGGYEVIIFPELRDLKAIGISAGGGIITTQTSVNTTNGLDGTWTTIANPVSGANTREAMRNSISTVVANGIKAIRFALTAGLSFFAVPYMHLYGVPSVVNDRLEFWHPTLDQPLSDTPAFLDWGNRPRSSVATKQVRIKNRSSTLTASSIVVGMEALTDASPTFVSQHDFSLDGTTFSPTVVLSSLAPGALSGLITMRQSLLSTAVLSLWSQRIYANAGSWA